MSGIGHCSYRIWAIVIASDRCSSMRNITYQRLISRVQLLTHQGLASRGFQGSVRLRGQRWESVRTRCGKRHRTRQRGLCGLSEGIKRRESIHHVVLSKHILVDATEELNMDDELGRSQTHLPRGEREPHLPIRARCWVGEDL